MGSSRLPALELPLPASIAVNGSASPQDVQNDVLLLFEECGPKLGRYVQSFGLDAGATEDILQEVFLSLFHHLRLGRPRSNLNAWLFQVAHNLALRQRRKTKKRQADTTWNDSVVERLIDPAANPEERVADSQRRRRLRSVVRAMPERDRRCLQLRAEGLRYRDIARVLHISLGSVAKSLTRSITRLTHADGG